MDRSSSAHVFAWCLHGVDVHEAVEGVLYSMACRSSYCSIARTNVNIVMITARGRMTYDWWQRCMIVVLEINYCREKHVKLRMLAVKSEWVVQIGCHLTELSYSVVYEFECWNTKQESNHNKKTRLKTKFHHWTFFPFIFISNHYIHHWTAYILAYTPIWWWI